MATIASMIAMPEYSPKCEFLVENLFHPTYEQPELEFVCEIFGHESPWYSKIFAYLHHKTIPIALSMNQRKTFICCTGWYIILGDIPFWKHFDGTLLWYLSTDESKTMLEEVHQGICGAHSNGLTLARKLLKMGYYWPTMEVDAYYFLKRCVPC